MAKKKKESRFRFVKYSVPYFDETSGEIKEVNNSYVEINVDDLIDRYDYHDAPSSVTWYAEIDELIELRDDLNNFLESLK